jgi:hypothetical protein
VIEEKAWNGNQIKINSDLRDVDCDYTLKNVANFWQKMLIELLMITPRLSLDSYNLK